MRILLKVYGITLMAYMFFLASFRGQFIVGVEKIWSDKAEIKVVIIP